MEEEEISKLVYNPEIIFRVLNAGDLFSNDEVEHILRTLETFRKANDIGVDEVNLILNDENIFASLRMVRYYYEDDVCGYQLYKKLSVDYDIYLAHKEYLNS